MCEEIRDGLRRVITPAESKPLGSKEPDGWAPIELMHKTQSIISQVICRLLVGKTLSKDSEFTQKVADFSYSVILWSIILDWFPSAFRPWLAWTLPIMRTKKAISTVLRGDIIECFDSSRPFSQNFMLLQKLVETSVGEDPDTSHSINEIVEATTARVLSITFGAIDPTTVAFSQVVLDLLSQPSSLYLRTLQVEAKTILAAHGHVWTFEAVKNLKLMDR